MRKVVTIVLFLVCSVAGNVFGDKPKIKIKIEVECCPLKIVLGGAGSAIAYHGSAYVEGNDLVVELDPGTVLPSGGLVVDPSAKIAPAAATSLGLSAAQQLVSGTYSASATAYKTTGGGGPTIRLPLTASPSPSFTCVATVATDGGKAILGKSVMSGASINVGAPAWKTGAITAAASACHDFTRKAFAANLAWSDPAKVCARYPGSTTRQVEALDHLEELGNAGGYNRVGGYSVVCKTMSVTQLPTAPELVKR